MTNDEGIKTANSRSQFLKEPDFFLSLIISEHRTVGQDYMRAQTMYWAARVSVKDTRWEPVLLIFLGT